MNHTPSPLPPDAPPVVVGLGEVLWDLLPQGKQPGGAPANFAYHAQALGALGVIASQVGRDALGDELLLRLSDIGMNNEYITVDRAHPTGTVVVRLREDGQPEFSISTDVAWDYLAPSPSWTELAGRADAICFGTLGQRSTVSRQTIRQMLDLARPECLRVFDINIRQHYWSRSLIEDMLRRCDVVKLNDDELVLLQGELGLPPDEMAALSELRTRYGVRFVALTRGARGSVLLCDQGPSVHPGSPVQVVDAVGAGDAFTAALVMGLLRGADLNAINHDANLLAGFVCAHPGATPRVTPDLKRQLRVHRA